MVTDGGEAFPRMRKISLRRRDLRFEIRSTKSPSSRQRRLKLMHFTPNSLDAGLDQMVEPPAQALPDTVACGPEYAAGDAVPPLQRRTGDGTGRTRRRLPILQPLRQIAGQNGSIAQGGIHDGLPLQEIFARHAKPPVVETDRPRRRETGR